MAPPIPFICSYLHYTISGATRQASPSRRRARRGHASGCRDKCRNAGIPAFQDSRFPPLGPRSRRGIPTSTATAGAFEGSEDIGQVIDRLKSLDYFEIAERQGEQRCRLENRWSG